MLTLTPGETSKTSSQCKPTSNALEYSKFHSGRSRWLAESIERYIEQQGVVAELEAHGAARYAGTHRMA